MRKTFTLRTGSWCEEEKMSFVTLVMSLPSLNLSSHLRMEGVIETGECQPQSFLAFVHNDCIAAGHVLNFSASPIIRGPGGHISRRPGSGSLTLACLFSTLFLSCDLASGHHGDTVLTKETITPS